MAADAVDDYRITIPLEDIRDYDVIVAYAMNGRPLPRDAVWQLNRLTVQ